jgi:putative DNA primase/helicase
MDATETILAIIDAAAPPAVPPSIVAHKMDATPRQRRSRISVAGELRPGAAAPPGSADQASPKTFTAQTALPHFAADRAGKIFANYEARPGESVVLEASALDHSDTDNAERLRLYFGRDLTVMAQSGIKTGGQYLVWTGNSWDLDGGNSAANIIAQRVGDLIKAEADVLAATPEESKAINAMIDAKRELQAIDAAGDREEARSRRAACDDKIEAGMMALAALADRKKKRRQHAVTSKNAGKIEAMLNGLLHHLRRPPDDFNRDPMLVVTETHTLRFLKTVDAAGKVTAKVDARAAHDRADLITAMIPLAYDPAATCPKFVASMERFQPESDRRRTIQQFTGIGLLGVPIQKVMYHYGTGGNFKSVFLEVITRTLGDAFAIGLPAESVSGREQRSAGQASPDLERTFGKRMLRVLELPDGQPLQAPTIKKLTGGEKWPVRTLYRGYYEFQPRAKTHMSGNSLPHYDGSDGGLRRRLMLVEWPVTIDEAEQRDFEEVVAEFMTEAPGILNWLIAGALDYLQNDLFIAKSVVDLTKEQTEEMDPIGQFFRDCVKADPGGAGVQARRMYLAYEAWSKANAKRVRSENKFGRELKKLCRRDDTGAVHIYQDVRLHDVPASSIDEARAAERREHDGHPEDDPPVL